MQLNPHKHHIICLENITKFSASTLKFKAMKQINCQTSQNLLMSAQLLLGVKSVLARVISQLQYHHHRLDNNRALVDFYRSTLYTKGQSNQQTFKHRNCKDSNNLVVSSTHTQYSLTVKATKERCSQLCNTLSCSTQQETLNFTIIPANILKCCHFRK